MSDKLHEIIAQCAVIHNTNIESGIINNLGEIEKKLLDVDDDVTEHYLKLLMQYYFQKNNLIGLQKLLLQGYQFDLRFEDIKEAFFHIKSKDSVIEFFEDNVVMLKDVINESDLKDIYDFYLKNDKRQEFLDFSLMLIKKNRYVCAKAFKCEHEFAKFFINKDLLESIQRDMPYLLK